MKLPQVSPLNVDKSRVVGCLFCGYHPDAREEEGENPCKRGAIPTSCRRI